MLAHELSHVAHRDVLVMTVASSRRHPRRHADPGRAVRRHVRRPARRGNNNNGLPVWLVVLLVSLAVYAVSFLLMRLLSRYRELSADRAGAHLTMKPAALASALQKITGEIAAIPQQGPARVQRHERVLLRPGAQRRQRCARLLSTHPTLEQRLEQLARIQAELGRPEPTDGFLADDRRAQPAQAARTWTRCSRYRAPRSRCRPRPG